jgi:hypothetical protein
MALAMMTTHASSCFASIVTPSAAAGCSAMQVSAGGGLRYWDHNRCALSPE